LREALGGGHAERAKTAGLHVRERIGVVGEGDLGIARRRGRRRRRPALVGDVHHVNARHVLEDFACELRQAAGAGEVQLAWLRFGERNQLAHVLRRHRRMHHQYDGKRVHERDGREILEAVVAGFLQELQERLRRGRGHEDRIAVRWRLRHMVGRDDAARPGAVVDQDRLSDRFLHLRRDQARRGVGDAAGREGHHHANGLGGPGLARNNPGEKAKDE
jgi:hypothetical protein